MKNILFESHPLPWRVRNRHKKADKKHHHAYVEHVITDANGRDVWMTQAVAEEIVSSVNSKNEELFEDFEDDLPPEKSVEPDFELFDEWT